MSPSFPVSPSLSLAVSLGLTHRAERIVGFPHKVFIQPLEYNLGHSLKRGRADPGGMELAGGFTGRQSSGTRFSGLDFMDPEREIPSWGSGAGFTAPDPRNGLCKGLPRWTLD